MLKNSNYSSPNFSSRPAGSDIDTIVIHFTEMDNDVSALERLCNIETQVSAHYLINKNGQVFSLVPEYLRAWHAGTSHWKGRAKLNDFSIGIELDNNGHEEFSALLMNSLIELCHELIKTHPINPFYILGHSDIAPGRKADPGRYFNWKMLAKNGISIYPADLQKAVIPDIKIIQAHLLEYGYKIEVTGVMDQSTLAVMKAFNEHFNQECLKPWDEHSQAMLNSLIYLLRELPLGSS
jgi:N-acetylmuramoyl-L-alanine amidase